MKLKLLIVFLLFSTIAFSQDETPKKQTNDWDTSIAFHGGIGVQKSVYAEFGISKFSFIQEGWVAISKGCYASIEVAPTLKPETESHIYGFKMGCEYSLLLTTVAIEAKYQTDLELNDFVITPKIGLGAWGTVTAYYGYAISLNDKPFSRIGIHQFSVICNLNKRIVGY